MPKTKPVKKSTKGAKPKKTGMKKKGTNSSVVGYRGHDMMAAMQVCSLTNPFCPEAKNGKWPDNTFVKSTCWSTDGDMVPITTNASGDGSMLFLPQSNFTYVNPTTISGDTIVYGTTASQIVSFPNNVARFRITSWGLKLQVATPAMTTQGVLQLRLFSPSAYLNSTGINKASRLADVVEDVPLSRMLGKDYFVIPSPMGDEARAWRLNTGTAAWLDQPNIGWQIVNIGISGGIASTVCLRVGLYYNYEIIFDDASVNTLFATPPPANNLKVREASAGVTAKVGNFFAGAASTLDTIVRNKAVQQIASFAASVYTGNPNTGRGMLMLGNGYNAAREVD